MIKKKSISVKIMKLIDLQFITNLSVIHS